MPREFLESRWADHACVLRQRIRDRFRVAVGRHWHQYGRRRDFHYTVVLRRWGHLFHSLCGQSAIYFSPDAMTADTARKFYCKRVENRSVDEMDDSLIIRMLRVVTIPILGNASHAFMHGLNTVQIHGVEKLHKVLLERPKNRPLLTVSNHVAAVDDPFVVASLLPPSTMLDARNIRWTLCATDRCFTNSIMSVFFRSVKVLPVSRGEGIYQKGMDLALLKLNNGGWVHIFPEGSRSKDGGKTMSPVKRGVGRLVMDADNIPIVIPFVHTGMQEIMPIGTHLPRTGKIVTVVIGDPIDFGDLTVHKDADSCHISQGTLYDEVASRIGHELGKLKVQADHLALEHISEAKTSHAREEHASALWHQVDWEAFGIRDSMSPELFTEIAEKNKERSFHHRQLPSLEETLQDGRPAGLPYGGDILSRIRYMSPSDLMGFAARGLFINNKLLAETN